MNAIRDYKINVFVYVPDYASGVTQVDYERFELITRARKMLR